MILLIVRSFAVIPLVSNSGKLLWKFQKLRLEVFEKFYLINFIYQKFFIA